MVLHMSPIPFPRLYLFYRASHVSAIGSETLKLDKRIKWNFQLCNQIQMQFIYQQQKMTQQTEIYEIQHELLK